MRAMDRRHKCAECRFCRARAEPSPKKEELACARKPARWLEGGARIVCAEFALPEIFEHWGA